MYPGGHICIFKKDIFTMNIGQEKILIKIRSSKFVCAENNDKALDQWIFVRLDPLTFLKFIFWKFHMCLT